MQHTYLQSLPSYWTVNKATFSIPFIITEWMGLLELLSYNLLRARLVFQLVPMMVHVLQDHFQPGSNYLQVGRLHNLFKSPVLMLATIIVSFLQISSVM